MPTPPITKPLYAEAQADLEAFWAKQAENLDWYKKWDTGAR